MRTEFQLIKAIPSHHLRPGDTLIFDQARTPEPGELVLNGLLVREWDGQSPVEALLVEMRRSYR